MNAVFVTGTDTGVGKTYFCALLLDFLRREGVGAAYQKWVCTGTAAGMPEDLAFCAATAGLAVGTAIARHVPYRFGLAASPHLAAEVEGQRIDPGVLVDLFRRRREEHDFLIVEGVGGVMVPLNRELLLVDLVASLESFPVLVVARSGLGTINHTLLTLEALRRRKIPVLGVVFNDSSPAENDLIAEDNMRTVGEIGRVRVYGRLAFQEDMAAAKALFAPLGRALLAEIN